MGACGWCYTGSILTDLTWLTALVATLQMSIRTGWCFAIAMVADLARLATFAFAWCVVRRTRTLANAINTDLAWMATMIAARPFTAMTELEQIMVVNKRWCVIARRIVRLRIRYYIYYYRIAHHIIYLR